jgi:hypothetical protein
MVGGAGGGGVRIHGPGTVPAGIKPYAPPPPPGGAGAGVMAK